ncbi:MAG: uridine kinase [Clostridiales bacterium]|nr:uridine kinase [Clostridiales bacterium]
MSNVDEIVTNPVMTTLCDEINKLVTGSQRSVIVAIDGNCGSGKTFYASRLATCFDAAVIHCDHFFLPKSLRTAERIAQLGGNIHYERLREVLATVRSNLSRSDGKCAEQLTYLAYDCSTETFRQVTLRQTNVVIVEGSYALHPSLREFYDLAIVFTVDKQVQHERLLAREGEQGLANFVNKWIPLENRYFANLDTSDCVVIDTSK